MKAIQTVEAYWELPEGERTKVYIPENIMAKYPIKDTGEPLISAVSYFKEKKTKLVYRPPEDFDRFPKRVMLRIKPVVLLHKAAKLLPKGYYFRIAEGFRPLWLQKKYFNKIYGDIQRKYPIMTRQELWQETTKYIADPGLCPPHSTGGTVDITICDLNDMELDMGIPINSIDEKSTTFHPAINGKQMENRLLLLTILTSVGFVNLPTEWWHYSYGDQYWAIYNRKPHAIYNKVEQ